MVIEDTRALVSFDDRKNNAPQNPDSSAALRCKNFLMQRGVKVEVKGYSNSFLEAETDWLIVIHSDGQSSHIGEVVKRARDLVVERRMRDVMIITTRPSDLRPEWASIRKYDVSDPREENAALSDMLRAMESVKLPYAQAQELYQRQRRHARSNGQQKARSMRQLATVIIPIVVIMLIIASGVIFLPGLLHLTSTSTATAAATATARAQSARATQTAAMLQASPSVSGGATQTARQQELSTLTKGAPTIQGFRTVDQWAMPTPTSISSCALASNTYIVNMKNPNQYMPCLAAKTAFMNVVMQVTMKIQGDAGGVIFRSDSRSKEYYRLAVNQSDATTPTMDTFSLKRCDANCTDNSVTSGTSMTDTINTSVQVDRAKPITVTLVARATTFDVFINGKFMASITDTSFTTPWPGQIGVYAASLGKDTTVTFSDLKVWDLDDHPPAQPKNTPTSKPTSTPTAPSVFQPTVV